MLKPCLLLVSSLNINNSTYSHSKNLVFIENQPITNITLCFELFHPDKTVVDIEGVQDMPHQDVPFRHVDYFEPKAIETLQAQGKLLPLL